MGRHDNKCMHSHAFTMFMKAVAKDKISSLWRQHNLRSSTESDEVRGVRLLDVREVTAIHGKQNDTAEGGCAT